MQTVAGERARIAALEAKLAKKDAVIAEVSEEYLALKKTWGELRQRRVPHDLRDTVVDFARQFSARTELPMRWVLGQLGVCPTQFYRWTERYRRVNTHNGQTPRYHWLTSAECDAILAYCETHAPEGYRRMTFMMPDADVVAVSPATVYRVLRAAGVLDRCNRTGTARRWMTRNTRRLASPPRARHFPMSTGVSASAR